MHTTVTSWRRQNFLGNKISLPLDSHSIKIRFSFEFTGEQAIQVVFSFQASKLCSLLPLNKGSRRTNFFIQSRVMKCRNGEPLFLQVHHCPMLDASVCPVRYDLHYQQSNTHHQNIYN